jgi:hypothetical protein
LGINIDFGSNGAAIDLIFVKLSAVEIKALKALKTHFQSSTGNYWSGF